MNWLHRTVGLFLGVWLMLVGLTGAFLVFYKEIDSALYSKYLLVDHPTASPDIDFLLGRVKEKFPDRAVLFLERYGIYDNESYPFVLSKPLQVTPAGLDMSGIDDINEAASLEVFLDPQSGEFLGQRPYWNWIKLIRSFHQEILVPGPGERVVGALGITLMITSICGIVLWWRESKKRLPRSLRLRLSSPMPKLIRDIHTVGGIYIVLFLIIQGLGGAIVADWFPLNTLIASTFGAPKPPRPPAPAPVAGAVIPANQARDIALEAHPLSDVVQIVFPAPARNSYSVRLFPTDQSKFQNTRQILLNASTGKVVFRFDPNNVTFINRVLGSWMIWMHNGQFYGMPGRLIVLVTGIMLTLFFPTGIYIWYRQRSSRKAAMRRRAVA